MFSFSRSLLLSAGLVTGFVGAEPRPVSDMALLLYLAEMVEVEGKLTDAMALAEWESGNASHENLATTETKVKATPGEETGPEMKETRKQP